MVGHAKERQQTMSICCLTVTSGRLELEERSSNEAGGKWVTGAEGGRLGTEGEGGS